MRPRPLSGESLSSWRQRAGWANGYSLFPTLDERTRRVDPDVGSNLDDLVWLADAHQLSFEDVRSLSLAGYVGRVVTDLDGVKHPRFWLRARLRNRVNSYGPMFCPHCLAEDAVPYFRLAWRFAFVTECDRHKCELLDHCPNCKSPGWPTAVGEVRKISNKFQLHKYCWQCGFDLSSSQTVESANGVGRQLLNGVQSGRLRLGKNVFPILEVLQAVRGVCQLYLRAPARKIIADANLRWADVIGRLTEETMSALSIDHVSVSQRNLLMPLAFEIVSDWPNTYRRFASENKLSAMSLGVNKELHPEWMNKLIHDEFRLVTPTTDCAVVRDFCNDWLDRTGKWPTKTDVRNEFGSKAPNKAIRAVFYERDVATDEESMLYCERLNEQVDIAKSNRKNRKVRLLDFAALTLAALTPKNLNEMQYPAGQITKELQSIASMGNGRKELIKVATKICNLLAEDCINQTQVERRPKLRRLQIRNKQLMRGMDVRLLLEPSVLFKK